MIDVVVIGAGPSGITAAIYALRAGLDVAIIEKNIYGGQTSIIDSIENYPGFIKISGADFSNALYEQVKKLGVKFVFSEVKDVNFNENLKTVYLSNGEKLEARSVIIANGLKRRKLGCEGEKEFFGKGVSYCATCDGAFFKNKSVIVVGGGNTALEDALYLSNICKDVSLIVRKNYFRGEKYLVDMVKNTNNINVMFESSIKKIIGEKSVNSVSVLQKDKSLKEIKTDGVFIAVGYQPDNEIYKNKIDMDENDYFVANETCKTNVSGVFVAGDCRVKPLRQIATAVSDGAVSGNGAAAYVLKQNYS